MEATDFENVYNVIDRVLETASKSIVDNKIDINSKFVGDSGLSPKVIRKLNGKCCDWCTKIAGTYEYPFVPKDVYRRHDNCDCTVDYVVGDKKTSIHSGQEGKRTYVQDEYGNYEKTKEARIAHTEKMKETEEERKRIAREKRMATWQEKKQNKGKTLEENLMQKNRGEKVFITDQSIQKVRIVEPKGFSDETNKYIQSVHKELLDFSRNENFSDEVACVVDLRNNSRLNFVKGTRHEVNILSDTDSYHLLSSAEENSLMICHNHPGQTYFSLNDISMFMGYHNVKAMSIVNNQGKVNYISKTEKINYKLAADTMKEYSEKYGSDMEKIIDKFIKTGYNYGIESN